MVTLDILSDPICPWCYIGKARLDQAIAETGQNPFDMNWRMFRLNSDMPPEGIDRKLYLETKFGGADEAARIYGVIAETAKATGLDLRLDEIPRTPNTLDAHRLIRWAESTGNQSAVAHQLFVRYMERCEDISDREVLLDVAESAGMEREVVARLLDSDADRDALVDEEQNAQRMGVTGVPCFVIGGRYVLQGAQDVETWKKVIAEITEALAANNRQADQSP
jgi:predicted DsbA family dithiol-disulfide isomerase